MSAALATGTRLGPYEIVELLGRGGMGEVYRARDPRLGRDVAVKVLPADVAQDPRRLARFEREARAVAALNHPSVLTVHDVGTADGRAYLVTELLEGRSLREVIRGPASSLRRALELALQVARGLEAAHARGIVHRDIKPENLLVTPDGRIKILDFGIARLVESERTASAAPTGTEPTHPSELAGTISYMSPEQARGQPVDARTDVFSLGIILYELLSGRHPFRRSSAAATLEAILDVEPEDLAGAARGVSPALAAVVHRCLAKPRAERYPSGHELALALETLLGVPKDAPQPEEATYDTPYPGLASFTETDASSFFGREAEVTDLWHRLRERHLLAVIGPSGAGKTSFVRAGVVPRRPEGWGALVVRPGDAPGRNLARALAREVAGDSEAVESLLLFDDADVVVEALGRWRRGYREALLVLDQFEELFTLNTERSQKGFASLLGRLAEEADIHLLLSLRDDFLMRCYEHPALAPVFECLTPLGPMDAASLRRVVVEPARRLGFAFEADTLVVDLVAAVSGERGALPLLAFAMRQLWEERDREHRLLTREAFERIGGVAGALAVHAEATLERIGSGSQGLVREIFRNLVTPQGTRAVADRVELLSGFPDRNSSEEVLRLLVEARLLTTYETEARDGRPTRCIEIVHESLLRGWPRLVRWQTQDADGAVLREQLRQAAHLWRDRGRPAELLWSGAAYRDFEVWRERYRGTLTEPEQRYASAMVARERRQRRRRRLAVTSLTAVSLVIAAVIAVLWQDALRSARLAEAARLVALGRLQIDDYPTAGLAFARKSLQVADNPAARRLAVEALWRGATARILPLDETSWSVAFSPDGTRLAAATFSEKILLASETGGLRTLTGFTPPSSMPWLGFLPSGDRLHFYARGDDGVQIVSLSDGRTVQRLRPEPADGRPALVQGHWPRKSGLLFAVTDPAAGIVRLGLRPYTGGPFEAWATARDAGARVVPGETRMVVVRRGRLSVRDVRGGAQTPEREIADVPGAADVFLSPGDRRLAVGRTSELTVLDLVSERADPPGERSLPMEDPDLQCPPSFDATASSVAWGSSGRGVVAIWDLAGPPDAAPRELRRPDVDVVKSVPFHPAGGWLAAANQLSVTLWAVDQPWARVLRGHTSPVRRVAFTPDSRWLASCGFAESVSLWPLDPQVGASRRRLGAANGNRDALCYGLTLGPNGRRALWGAWGTTLSPLDGRPGRWLVPPPDDGVLLEVQHAFAFDRSGRRAATADNYSRPPGRKTVRIFDLVAGTRREWPQVARGEPGDAFDGGIYQMAFLPDGFLMTAGHGGLRRIDPDTGEARWAWRLSDDEHARFAVSDDASRLVGLRSAQRWPVVGRAFRLDPEGRAPRFLEAHGSRVSAIAMDASGTVLVTGDEEGAVRVGRLEGGKPHLLLGHEGLVLSVAISPDGRWIASSSGSEIRLWPMPDLDRPPLHSLPYDELMRRLRSFTNLEAVEDPSSASGYRLGVGPFPGWRDLPVW